MSKLSPKQAYEILKLEIKRATCPLEFERIAEEEIKQEIPNIWKKIKRKMTKNII